MIEHKQTGRLSRQRQERLPVVREIDDQNAPAGKIGGGWVPVFDGPKFRLRELLPQCPRRAEAVRAISVIKDHVRGLMSG